MAQHYCHLFHLIGGHIYIFTAFTWYQKSQLAVVVAFNACWYCWWSYCWLIVLNFYLELRSSTELLEGGQRADKVETSMKLPHPPI